MNTCKTCGDPLYRDRVGEGDCPQCDPYGHGLEATQQEAYVAGFEEGRASTDADIVVAIPRSLARRLCGLQLSTMADYRDKAPSDLDADAVRDLDTWINIKSRILKELKQ